MDTVCRISKHRQECVSYIRTAVFGGGRAKGTLKILQELLNHEGLVAVVRAGITYLTSKCPAGAGSPLRILFHDRTLNHDASVAFNDDRFVRARRIRVSLFFSFSLILILALVLLLFFFSSYIEMS